MFDKIKKAIKKMKPVAKKEEPKFNNMNDLQNGIAVNRESKSETKSDTKSSLVSLNWFLLSFNLDSLSLCLISTFSFFCKSSFACTNLSVKF